MSDKNQLTTDKIEGIFLGMRIAELLMVNHSGTFTTGMRSSPIMKSEKAKAAEAELRKILAEL